MLEKVTNLAERWASQGGMSRRGFLGWFGRRAAAVAFVAGGLLARAPFAWAGPHHRCADDSDCGPHGFCYRQGGGCEGEGYCVSRKTREDMACYELYLPVCGCDGRTYVNQCFAFVAGANVAYAGQCQG